MCEMSKALSANECIILPERSKYSSLSAEKECLEICCILWSEIWIYFTDGNSEKAFAEMDNSLEFPTRNNEYNFVCFSNTLLEIVPMWLWLRSKTRRFFNEASITPVKSWILHMDKFKKASMVICKVFKFDFWKPNGLSDKSRCLVLRSKVNAELL